jgi:hypothetical protein
MNWIKKGLIFSIFIVVGCANKKQIYADRLIDYRNRHIYVNDSLDFSIGYFDVIGKRNRQTDSIDFKKTTVPPEFQKHLKQSVSKPSEILFSAHRASMSQEDIIAVLYDKQVELPVFSKKIIKNLSTFVSKDSFDFQQYQTASGFFLTNAAWKEGDYHGSDFMQNRSFNALRYFLHNAKSDYKIHEFHVPYDKHRTLRLIWIADIRKTVAQAGWEKIDDQNHYLELFTLNDSAKFRLQEVVPDNPFKIAGDAFKETGYPGAVYALSGFEPTVEKKGTFAQKSMYYQAMMTYYSFLGDHKKSLAYMDKAFGGQPAAVSDSVFMDYKPVDAAEYILQKVDNQQVVMFNEAHNCGQHRAFMRDILRGLYDKGFRHLALETLIPSDSINERGYPLRIKSGFYTSEPTFGQMLREAKAVGFQVWDYEVQLPCPSSDCKNFREAQQTENLKRILDKDPNGKILVWAGHGHIHENNDTSWQKMGFRFKKLTGIDPLTIETTALREHSEEKFESGYYRAALKKTQLTKPFVMLNKDSTFITPSLKGAVDMQIFFPRTDYTNDYPDWMGNATATFYDLTIEKEHFKDKLLKIFLLNEYQKEVEDAIPVMNIPLSRLGVFKLFLKPDKYIAVIRDGGNWEYKYNEFEVQNDIESDINALNTNELRKNYLKVIFGDDQKARRDLEETTSKFGQGSKEYQEKSQLMMKTDSINVVKIEKYLAKYGYPTQAVYGEIPAYTPWTVIHHSGVLEIRQRYFPLLLKAWKNKDIKENSFYLYLNRSYRIKFDKAFKRETGMTNVEEINQLIVELGFKL